LRPFLVEEFMVRSCAWGGSFTCGNIDNLFLRNNFAEFVMQNRRCEGGPVFSILGVVDLARSDVLIVWFPRAIRFLASRADHPGPLVSRAGDERETQEVMTLRTKEA
jgi:hypothetical protein